MPHGQDALDFVPNPATAVPDLSQLEKAKHSSEHIEEIIEHRPDDIVYTAGEDESKPRTGLRKLLRRNPSFEFIKEVAEENRKELDPVEVKRVERKLFWMIVPVLAVDYAFYYVRRACTRGHIYTDVRSTRPPSRTPPSLASRRTSTSVGRGTPTLVRSFMLGGCAGRFPVTSCSRTCNSIDGPRWPG